MSLSARALTPTAVRDIVRAGRRWLGLSPMQKVLRELRARGVDLASQDALEVFGGRGNLHTIDYANSVRSLQVWEIEADREADLRRHLPQATIRIVDSHRQIKETNDRFDLVVVDNSMSTYDGHCEHFDILPDVFRVVRDDAVVILNVIPFAPESTRQRFTYLFNPEQLQRRAEFYRTSAPENVSFETMVGTYHRRADDSGFATEWHFLVRRHFVHYLTLKIRRKTLRA
jgi:hypothetical protein